LSFVTVAPDALGTSAQDLADIGITLSQVRTAVAASTTGVVAAAQDGVSAAVAAFFSVHGEGFQTFGAQVSELHDQLVDNLTANAMAYGIAEAAGASPLDATAGALSTEVNPHSDTSQGHPTLSNDASRQRVLFGHGENGGSGAAGRYDGATGLFGTRWGGAGGWLFGGGSAWVRGVSAGATTSVNETRGTGGAGGRFDSSRIARFSALGTGGGSRDAWHAQSAGTLRRDTPGDTRAHWSLAVSEPHRVAWTQPQSIVERTTTHC
jgi:PE family